MISLYRLYDFQNTALMPWRMMGDLTKDVLSHPLVPLAYTPFGKSVVAGLEVAESVVCKRGKPAWNIQSVEVDGKSLPVSKKLIREKPFCKLERFVRRGGAGKLPKILLVAPMSGHHATLLRGTVQAMVQDHEVYVTDWVDAQLVPLSDGDFGLDEYIDYLLEFMRLLAPNLNVMAVCQPAPLVLSAVSLLATADDPAQPKTMTLMGGPIDTRAAPTQVTEFGESQPIEWFRNTVLSEVPSYYPGGGREVYPGFVQLSSFISMNAPRHMNAHVNMFHHLIEGDGDSAEAHRKFYDEYLAVMDSPARYYLETVETIFQTHLLPKGQFKWRDIPVRPQDIKKTALLTVEGELDDISAPGQTTAAHTLCSNLPDSMQADHLQPGVGHYGIFNGRRWREIIKPRIAAFIQEHA
ncbi:polyhydroxyalkanoate depolymerase [Rhodovibrionaceae bacterium A322]